MIILKDLHSKPMVKILEEKGKMANWEEKQGKGKKNKRNGKWGKG